MTSTTTIIAKTRSLLSPRARRAFLYLQGYDTKKINKVSTQLSTTLDCVCLDMEDGVAINKKEQARDGIVHALQHVNFGSRIERVVRINSFDTGDLAQQDLHAILNCPVLPDAICIPKVESSEDILQVSDRLDTLGDVAFHTRIIGMIESPTAILNMNDICNASPHRFDCVIFGADDYASKVGATRTKDSTEINFAKNYILLHAAAYNLSYIDQVLIDYKDDEQLRKESIESYQLGYVGKQIIHPKQIQIVQDSYTPKLEDVEYAKCIVEANVEHQKQGYGAFSYEGKMIDAPTVKQYENLLQVATLMGIVVTE